MEAAAGITFAARWCGDLPELLLARAILEDKFGGDFAAAAKEGAGIVDPMVST
jgi:vacuolar protein sorting-associated protein IST1